MKRLLASGFALGLIGASSIAGAGLAGAQEPAPDLDLAATLSPDTVAPGATITVQSDDVCDVADGERFLYWDVWPADEEDFPPGDEVDLGMEDLSGDGSWQVTFDAPATAGAFNFWPLCASSDGGSTMVIEQEYAPLPFTVQGEGDPAPTQPMAPIDRDMPESMPLPDLGGVAPEAMPAATPVVGRPTWTG
jgi:hypothetical protein